MLASFVVSFAVIAADQISCANPIDAALSRDLVALCATAPCDDSLLRRFRSELRVAGKRKVDAAEQVRPPDEVVARWLITLASLGERLPNGTLVRPLLETMGRELSSGEVLIHVEALAVSAGCTPSIADVLLDVLAPLANEPLTSLALDDRCLITRVLAQQAIDLATWMDDMPETGEVGFAVLLLDDVPLLRPGEVCAVKGGKYRKQSYAVVVDPTKLAVGERPRYLYFDWRPTLRPGARDVARGKRLVFSREFCEGVPSPNIPGSSTRYGRTHVSAPAPRFEVELRLDASGAWTDHPQMQFWPQNDAR